jgi:hypothetical protein
MLKNIRKGEKVTTAIFGDTGQLVPVSKVEITGNRVTLYVGPRKYEGAAEERISVFSN